MDRSCSTDFRAVFITTWVLALFFPGVAAAGWGNENWGEMVWDGFAGVDIPSLPAAGFALLAALLLGLSYWLLTTRRRRSQRPPLHS